MTKRIVTKRIVTLTEDAKLLGDFVDIHYGKCFGVSMSKDKFPPIETLKKGTKLRITYDGKHYLGGAIVLKVELK